MTGSAVKNYEKSWEFLLDAADSRCKVLGYECYNGNTFPRTKLPGRAISFAGVALMPAGGLNF